MDKNKYASRLRELVIEIRQAQHGCRELRRIVEDLEVTVKQMGMLMHFMAYVECSLTDGMSILAGFNTTRRTVTETVMMDGFQLADLEDSERRGRGLMTPHEG